MARDIVGGLILLLALANPIRARAVEAPAPIVLTWTLNSLSYVSFNDQLVLPIGGGGTIRLSAYPNGDGQSVALRIAPVDLGTRTLSLGANKGQLTAQLLRTGKGFLRATKEGGLTMELDVVVRVTYSGPKGQGIRELPLHLTTEAIHSWDAAGTTDFSVNGTRADPASRVVQLVGAFTAGKNDEPVPGAAIYLVLSGVLDQIPALAPAAAVPSVEN